ncbi:Ldh family oxidoreductase [Prauserella cavernicola]|uniref:Ldh family oxidoreductase n=1 Tax=Prauserella cavernicola TaxID=2800127 RepID=A0A934V758_9PSEU|nr:Ldh family oxidoreductase [Prauserella cavernicola]MBK1787359.1 Ldh family oxidoreductase [Prauserella cavernicola]
MASRAPGTSERYDAEELRAYARRTLERVGIDAELASPMADRLLDGDLLGHRSHGLWFLSTYLRRISDGHIRGSGEIEVVHASAASASWRAHRLPGAWVMDEATRLILKQITSEPVVTVTIADCSHIGCLQSFLLPFTDRGLLAILTATNPGVASVAAPGGSRPVITTNPIAMGIPTRSEPILVDQCTSVASNALFESYAERGERLPGQWLLDATGRPTDDPQVLRQDPPGTIQSLGQADFGYKGFGFGLMSEALSLALPGYGRRDNPDRHGQGVFLQVIDPGRFAGTDDYFDELDHLVGSIRADPGVGGEGVRLPGERALRSRAEQLADGIALHPDTPGRLRPWSDELGVPFPRPR